MCFVPGASSSPSKSPMHYAHTDGGVSAIRCLDLLADRPLRLSSTCSPSQCLRGSYQSRCCQNFRIARSSQSWQNSQQPRIFEHRLLLFLLTERGSTKISRSLFASIAKFSAGLPQMFT